ncbi:hypothetical protein C3E79_07295 [Corynebacterium liangguodongii]|uniref:Uncharacterized protein n=2 Tax=Corynebacterium liangguodongii TaxID=2079535 RepID=A0A2S0WH55_9CORY|nr:hypothetical protein C3E79_07295 [Corynebacterium liangguodongii]PWB99954.1 hypothetical protein DF219_03890 [Corynebacterium liangguodongii]
MYYDAGADAIRLDQRSIDYSRVTPAEVEEVRSGLEKLSDDLRRSAGVEGTTDSGAASREGGYRFECQK